VAAAEADVHSAVAGVADQQCLGDVQCWYTPYHVSALLDAQPDAC
jgi:hypothetical protein